MQKPRSRKHSATAFKVNSSKWPTQKTASPNTSIKLDKTWPTATAQPFLGGYILTKTNTRSHYLAGNLVFHMFQKKALLLRYKLHLHAVLAQ